MILTRYGYSQVANTGSCTAVLLTACQVLRKALFQVMDTRGYLILGREMVRKRWYIHFPKITPLRLTQEQKMQANLKAIRINTLRQEAASEKNQGLRHLRVQLLNGVVLVNGKKHRLPITRVCTERIWWCFQWREVHSQGKNSKLHWKRTMYQFNTKVKILVKIKAAYKEELQRLCDEELIMLVQEHTEWTNSIVSVRKADSGLRLCLDLKDLNKNIERNQYYTRTIDDIGTELHGSKYFMLMDAKSGYRMVWLNSPESPLLMIFNMPWGKYRWLWLPFSL